MSNGSRGFTLLELLSVLAVIAVLVSIGTPSLSNLLTRRRTEAAALELQAQLQQTRSLAIKSNNRVFVSFAVSANSWRYGVNDNGVCDPNTAGNCTVNGIEQVFSSDAWKGVALTLNQIPSSSSLGFEPRRGMAIDSSGAIGTATMTFQSSAGTVQFNVSSLGYINLCAPSGSGITRFGHC